MTNNYAYQNARCSIARMYIRATVPVFALTMALTAHIAKADDRPERQLPEIPTTPADKGPVRVDGLDSPDPASPGRSQPLIRGDDELSPTEEATPFELPAVIPEAHAGFESELVLAGDFEFHGNTVVSREELMRVIGPALGRRLTAPQLEDIRRAVSRHYVDRGYINSGALYPKDFYRDGVIHMQIVEGHIDRLTLRGLRYLREFYVRNRLLATDEVFNANVLQERFQRLLNDPLFARVNARLEPSEKMGFANLEVDVTRARPWDASLFYNNHRSPSTGALSGGVSATLRNLTSMGDALDLRMQGRDSNSAFYGGDITLPLYFSSTQLRARYDHGRSVVLEEPLARFHVKSVLDSKEAGITQRLSNTLTREFSLGLSRVWRRNETYFDGFPFSFVAGEDTGVSKVRSWRLDQDYVERWTRGAIALRASTSYGKTNSFGSERNSQIPPERYLFWLAQAQGSWRALENSGDLILRLSRQWAHDRLVSLERFSVGGVQSVRGYRENQLVRDEGYAASIEFRYSIYDDPVARHRWTLIPFLDYAAASNKHEGHEKLASAGLGIAFYLKGLSAEVFYGKQLEATEIKTSGNLQDRGIHFQLRYAVP